MSQREADAYLSQALDALSALMAATDDEWRKRKFGDAFSATHKARLVLREVPDVPAPAYYDAPNGEDQPLIDYLERDR